ncbi:fimbria/pilus outer membrane usher protein [Xylophilus rhododendri]|uniref:Fimbria/pilus outer membrane usher protein n=1 Tax=Xylophilus rhododendri TaxID=2697032 RepID=A0A857IZ91_9BURK|nr:fimbria/pilus outer membrane usher protein [Xylophilus rhododendri]QHI96786.1 fimbria/pilus outer membrane usher protein [Xylophilus rhododendri]
MCWADRHGPALRLFRLLSATALLAAAGIADAAAPVFMVLDASVNGAPSRLLMTVIRHPDGSFQAKAGELRALRIRVDGATGDERWVALDAIPGLRARYDEQHQAIDLQVADISLAPYVLGLGGRRRVTDLSLIRPTPGVVLNYGLFAAAASQQPSTLSGNFEAIGMTPLGNLSTSALYNSQAGSQSAGQQERTVRLDSAWRRVDPQAVRSYAVGDFVSGALGWSSAIRMAGLQVQSAFRQRADLVTWALPQFSGSAALPSTLDMYVNSMKVFSGQVPVGPFELQAPPFISGGDVRIVTTDANGRQLEVTQPYYVAPGLLRAGLSEYSLDIGAPRRRYGSASADYDALLAGAGSWRLGLDERTTVDTNVQATTDGLRLAGLGLVRAVGGYGAVTLAGSTSSYRSETAGYLKIQGDAQFHGVRAYLGAERAGERYYDLARVSLLREALQRQSAEPWTDLSARASAIDRAGLNFQPWFDAATSIGLNYSRIEGPQQRFRMLNLSVARRLGAGLSAYLTAYRDLEDRRNYGLYATLSFTLGGNARGSVGVERSGGRNSLAQQLSGNTGSGQGTLNWQLSDREYSQGDAWRSAALGWRASFADLRAQVDRIGPLTRTSAQVNGSLVAAGGDVFAANRIGEAFAIVHNAGPDTEIRQGGARVAVANSRGNALLPQLQPYSETTISIDPTGLPVGWEPEATQRVVAAAWRQGSIADFGVKPSFGAVVVLQDPLGQPLPVGRMVQVEGSAQAAMLGHDGEVYLKGLAADNRVSVDLGAGASCSAAFAYRADDRTLPSIGPLTCR